MNETRKSRKKQRISPNEIDELVTAQADDDASWEAPIEVKRTNKLGSFSIPPDLMERAAFLAQVHHAEGIEAWITKVIRERIEIEEGAYAAVKRELQSVRGRRIG